jgi:hypothetical protein
MNIMHTIAALALLTSAAAAAEPPDVVERPGAAERLVTHNGSLMTVTMAPEGVVTINYLNPRPSLRAIGITPGTLLVQGRWDDYTKTFHGVAHVYGECGAVPYAVTGGIDPNQSLVLTGPVPIRFEGSCVPFAFEWNHNSRLQFDPLPTDALAQEREFK